MDWISLSALSGAANNANGGGGGGGGPSPSPTPSPSPGIPERTDEHYANTVLLLHGDGNPGANNVNNPAPIAQYMALSDDSPNDRQVSTVGTNVYGTDFNPFYYNAGVFSNSFDGDADALEIPTSDNFKFGTGDFTIECWIFPNGATQQSYAVVTKCAADSNWTGGWAIAFQNSPSNDKISFWIDNSQHLASSSALAPSQWHHIAVTRSGGTTNLYQNGVRVATGSSSYNFQPANEMVIGSDNTHTAYEFKGNISNLKIVKGRALYTGATYTEPTALFEDPTTHGELSVYFDGTGDQLSTDYVGDFAVSAPFTFEAWIYPNSIASGENNVLSTEITGGGNGGVVLGIKGSGTNLYLATQASGYTVDIGSLSIPVNAWSHIAIVVNGTGSNETDVYLNGTRVGQGTYGSTFSGNYAAFVGSDGRGNGLFNGYISNARISKNARYSGATITVPTTHYSPDSNTLFLTAQGKTFQDYSPSNHAIKRDADAHISEFGPFGDGYWSNYFDGTGDYIDLGSVNASLSATWCVELWYKKSDASTDVLFSTDTLDSISVSDTRF